MQIHNYMEDIVSDTIEEILSRREDDICKCEQCKLDIMALALNQLKPKYVVTEKGRIYTKLAEVTLQCKIDVTKEVARAVEQVVSNPRHSK